MTLSAPLTILLTLSLFVSVQSYFITIDAHDEECFFEKVTAGNKLGEWCEKMNVDGDRHYWADVWPKLT